MAADVGDRQDSGEVSIALDHARPEVALRHDDQDLVERGVVADEVEIAVARISDLHVAPGDSGPQYEAKVSL